MNALIRLKKTTPVLVIAFVLAWFALSPTAQAVVPPPDGGYPNFTTAEGTQALQSLTTGAGNTGVGFRALFSDTTGSFNTGLGAGALVLNQADSNTAVGAVALLLNTTGASNTAVGAAALLNNTEGSNNTATGDSALTNNTFGIANTANGVRALFSNTGGFNNTAVGFGALASNINQDGNTAIGSGTLAISSAGLNTGVGVAALQNCTTGSNNTALGRLAGNNVTTASNVICIGANVAGEDVSNTCFIGNISGVEVTGDLVNVDANGQLGVPPAGSPLSANELLKQQRVVQELKATTERQAAMIALQEGQIKALTAGLQKVSAQLEASKPAPQVVNNP